MAAIIYSDYSFTLTPSFVFQNGSLNLSAKNQNYLFEETKLQIQSLSYVGPSTWNSFPNNLKFATSVNSFKHNIEKYSFKKLGDVKVVIHSYALINPKMKLVTDLELTQDRTNIVSFFFSVSVLRLHPILSIFPLRGFLCYKFQYFLTIHHENSLM